MKIKKECSCFLNKTVYNSKSIVVQTRKIAPFRKHSQGDVLSNAVFRPSSLRLYSDLVPKNGVRVLFCRCEPMWPHLFSSTHTTIRPRARSTPCTRVLNGTLNTTLSYTSAQAPLLGRQVWTEPKIEGSFRDATNVFFDSECEFCP